MYLTIPGFSKYEVDENGSIRSRQTQIVEVATLGRLSKRPTITLFGDNWKLRSLDVARAVLTAFCPIDNPDWASVHYEDDDTFNVLLSNLRWDHTQIVPDEIPGDVVWDNYFRQVLEYPELEVSTKGVVRYFETKEILTQTTSSYGYKLVKTTGTTRRTVNAHRLVALAYIAHPLDTWHLVVNHKNGRKAFNAASNLEWCTYGQNNSHAMYMGFKGKLHAVEIMDIRTGLTKSFASINDAARWFNVNPGGIHWHLNTPRKRLGILNGCYIKKGESQEPWPSIEDRMQYINCPDSIRGGKKVWVRDMASKFSKLLPSVDEAARYVGIKHARPIRDKLLSETPEPYFGHFFVYDDGTGIEPKWPDYPKEIIDVWTKINMMGNTRGKAKPIKVYDKKLNTTEYWEHFTAWSRAHRAEIHDSRDIRWKNRPASSTSVILYGLFMKRWVIEPIILENYLNESLASDDTQEC